MFLIYDYLGPGKIDKQGLDIGLHWLYGGGEPISISVDRYDDSSHDVLRANEEIVLYNKWQKYMEDNVMLTNEVQDFVIPLGENISVGETIIVNETIHAEVENGESATGYNFLHGTNSTVGDFSISGSITKDLEGNVTYDLIYTWNDIIDPNMIYTSDQQKSSAAHNIPFANPTDYEIHISWRDISVLNSNGKGNTGWLSKKERCDS